MTEHFSSLLKQVAKFFSGTMLSRMTGLLREVIMAATFGTDPMVAAFWISFRLAHLFRRVFGEGGMHMAFIPHFEKLKHENEAQAIAFFVKLKQTLFWVLLSLMLILEIGLWCAFQKTSNPQSLLVLRFTMLLLPALLFICLYALNAAFLNCYKHIFWASVAPCCVNIVWIIATLCLRSKSIEQSLTFLCLILAGAFALQWLVTVFQLWPIVHSHYQKYHYSFKQLASLVMPFTYVLMGVAATQINSALDALFAAAADSQGAAILWYAIRIQQLPIAFLGVGISTAILPPLARLITQKKIQEFKKVFHFGMTQTLAFVVPLALLLFLLANDIIAVIYERGAFGGSATSYTSHTLQGYLLGLPPMVLVLLFASLFYAQKAYRVPLVITILTVLSNVFFNALFVYHYHFKAVSIAYATSIAAWIQLTLYLVVLHKKGLLTQAFDKLFLFKMSFACVISGLGLSYFNWSGQGFWGHLMIGMGKGICFVLIYASCALVLKMREYKAFLQIIQKKKEQLKATP